MSAGDHRAELSECYIAWEVIEATIRIHPQALRVDKCSDALDRLHDLLRRFYPVALDIDRADPKDFILWEVMERREICHCQ